MNYAIRFLITCYKSKFQLHKPHFLPFFNSLSFYSLFKSDNRDQEKIIKLWFPKHRGHHIQEIIAQADKLHEDGKYLEVYELLDRIRLAKEPNILWRTARALYNLSFHECANKENRVTMMTEARMILQMAFSCGGIENSDVHKWMAIVLDAQYGLLNLENRVKYSPLVKYHLKRACDLNPGDFAAHYMLGKWCYQMCQLSWFQRLIAKFIASEPPISNYAEAYKYLSHAEEIQPRSVLSNLYCLGSTCINIGQYFKAKYYLNLAISLTPQNESEKLCSIKAQNLMRKLKSYDVAGNVLFYDHFEF